MKKNKLVVLFSVLALVVGLFVFKQMSNQKVNKVSNDSIIKKETSNKEKEDNKKDNTENKSNTNTKQREIEPLDADENIDFSKLVAMGKPIILDFSQDGWHACKLLHPTLEKLHELYGDQITIKSIDIRKLRDFSSNYPIRVTPTIYFYNADGSAFVPSEELSKELNNVAYKKKDDDKIAISGNEGVLEFDTFVKIIKEMGVNVK